MFAHQNVYYFPMYMLGLTISIGDYAHRKGLTPSSNYLFVFAKISEIVLTFGSKTVDNDLVIITINTYTKCLYILVLPANPTMSQSLTLLS